MISEDYIKKHLLSNPKVKSFCEYLKNNNYGAYIAGGAITSIAVGKSNEIADYDFYFRDKESLVEAIRYMKEDNPHVSFISDKSITYNLDSETTVQFIYYDVYPHFENVFDHFDFTINCGLYEVHSDKVIVSDKFWMHNAQKFLEINPKTKFPILTMLRLDKYRKKGYKTSRKEVLKLGLTVSNLSIESWEDFKAQIGNQYGLDLADLTDTDGQEFSMEAAIDRLLEVEFDPENPTPCQTQYLHDINIIDYVVDGEPLEYCIINDEKLWINPEVNEYEDAVEQAIEKGTLSEKHVSKDKVLDQQYYVCKTENENVTYVETLETLKDRSWGSNSLVYPVKEIKEEDIDVKSSSSTGLCVKTCVLGDPLCRKEDIEKLKRGEEVSYLPQVQSMKEKSSFSTKGHAFSNKGEEERKRIATIKQYREEHLKKHVYVTSHHNRYAHVTYSGIILEGGEDITAEELCYFRDNWNTCFGAKCTIGKDGVFTGEYNTD